MKKYLGDLVRTLRSATALLSNLCFLARHFTPLWQPAQQGTNLVFPLTALLHVQYEVLKAYHIVQSSLYVEDRRKIGADWF